mmetsp:Transcript_30739/g.57574  ORF Transcript_30739/g.57574 Transcript_30739/m.57574 type:complete len:220 (+) Transcript_30739:496-1155(+)
MARKGSDDVVDASSLLGITSCHEILGPADNADGQTTSQRLPVADDVCLDIIGALSSTWMQAEASVDLIEDQAHAVALASLLQLVEPLLISGSRAHFAVVGRKHGVTRRRLVQVEALEGIHQHGGNLAASNLNDLKGEVVHVLQAQNILRKALVPSNRLHAIPPAMVSATKGDHQGLLGVEACHSHCAHDCLGARHVERNLILAGDLSKSSNVVQDDVVQ